MDFVCDNESLAFSDRHVCCTTIDDEHSNRPVNNLSIFDPHQCASFGSAICEWKFREKVQRAVIPGLFRVIDVNVGRTLCKPLILTLHWLNGGEDSFFVKLAWARLIGSQDSFDSDSLGGPFFPDFNQQLRSIASFRRVAELELRLKFKHVVY